MQASRHKNEDQTHAYFTLQSEEDRKNALAILNDVQFKGKPLLAKEADPTPDPLVKKRQQNASNKQLSSKSVLEEIDSNFDLLSEKEKFEKINKQVASLWNVPYEEQLITKVSNLKKVMRKCFNEYRKIFKCLSDDVKNQCSPILDWFWKVPFETIVPSPVVNGYRNKCEFNIDFHNNIGFRLGKLWIVSELK